MFLGIEIGGTKLQLGVGTGDGPPLVAMERRDVDRAKGAASIRRFWKRGDRYSVDFLSKVSDMVSVAR